MRRSDCTIAVVALAMLAHLLAGCMFAPDPIFYRYVYDKGGPTEIAQWAIQQSDPGRIRDAMFALKSYLDRDNQSEETVSEAGDAMVAINSAYHAGWKITPTDDSLSNPRFIPSRCYHALAEAATFNEHARVQFFAIEPPQETMYHDNWVNAARSSALLP